LAAAQVLSRRCDTPPDHFVPLLQDASFEVRLLAVQFLGQVPHPQIAEYLLPLLSDSDSDVRQATATALGRTGSPSAVEGLVLALADEERLVRAMAERALEQIDSNWPLSEAAQRAAVTLQALLEVRPPWVRSAIQQVLGKIGTAAG
jgi:HEAT repeat protein